MAFQNEVRGEEKYQCLKSQCNVNIADCHSFPRIRLRQNSCLILRRVIFSYTCGSTGFRLPSLSAVQDCKSYRETAEGWLRDNGGRRPNAKTSRGTDHKLRVVINGSNCSTRWRCRLGYRHFPLANANGKMLNEYPVSRLVAFPGSGRCINVIVWEYEKDFRRNRKLHYWRAGLRPGFGERFRIRRASPGGSSSFSSEDNNSLSR